MSVSSSLHGAASSLYYCHGCAETIPAQKARIRCQQCPDYDLCANCAVLGTVTRAHISSHSTTLYRTSGFSGPPPPPPGYALPPQSGYASAPPLSAYTSVPPQAANGSPSGSGVAAPPQAPPQHPTAAWTHLFEPNTWQPTSSFTQLTAAIFERLDLERTGYVTPEAHSALLDVIGIPLSQNFWKQVTQAGFGSTSSKERQADTIIKQAYDVFSIEHVLRPRPQPANNETLPGTAGSFLRALTNLAAPPSQVPLLTINGFAELCRIEALSDPDKSLSNLNAIMRHYGLTIWRERGNLPRWALPPAPVPQMLQRLAHARAVMAAQAQNVATATARNHSMAIAQSDASIRASAESIDRMGEIGTGSYYRTEYRYI